MQPTGTILNGKYCRDCGITISTTAVSCPSCGGRQAGNAITHSGDKSRPIAIILAILLGWIGIHKFYLGQMTQGILYLVFSWTLIPLFLSVVDIIKYLIISDDEFNRKYA